MTAHGTTETSRRAIGFPLTGAKRTSAGDYRTMGFNGTHPAHCHDQGAACSSVRRRRAVCLFVGTRHAGDSNGTFATAANKARPIEPGSEETEEAALPRDRRATHE